MSRRTFLEGVDWGEAAGIEVKTAEDMIVCIRERGGREIRIVVVLMREEEWSRHALITNPLFGLAYLVRSISCDVATTMVHVST